MCAPLIPNATLLTRAARPNRPINPQAGPPRLASRCRPPPGRASRAASPQPPPQTIRPPYGDHAAPRTDPGAGGPGKDADRAGGAHHELRTHGVITPEAGAGCTARQSGRRLGGPGRRPRSARPLARTLNSSAPRRARRCCSRSNASRWDSHTISSSSRPVSAGSCARAAARTSGNEPVMSVPCRERSSTRTPAYAASWAR